MEEVDPDCRAGKHLSCVGDPCTCWCHQDTYVKQVVFTPVEWPKHMVGCNWPGRVRG